MPARARSAALRLLEQRTRICTTPDHGEGRYGTSMVGRIACCTAGIGRLGTKVTWDIPKVDIVVSGVPEMDDLRIGERWIIGMFHIIVDVAVNLPLVLNSDIEMPVLRGDRHARNIRRRKCLPSAVSVDLFG